MKAAMLGIVLGLLSLFATGCALRPQAAAADQYAVRLEFAEGTCSGTIVGPHEILSATHCFAKTHFRSVDGIPAKLLRHVDDGSDHTVIWVDQHYLRHASLGPAPKATDRVHIFGNPGPFKDLYRDGAVYGTIVVDDKVAMLYGINGWFGDSGSGIFDTDGRLVGVVSFVWCMSDGASWQAMGSFPLNFTARQWAQVQS